MIEIDQITKRFGSTVAVDDLTFTVRPGVVTGFLGPNGAGKSTTMRMILGLDRPTSGRAMVAGRAYADLRSPMRTVGALLDAGEIHPRRTARAHLLSLAMTIGEGRARVDEVLDLVGLSSVAGKRAGTFSLGMRQRLGIAAALLGDPEIVVLDEPVNGLDPEGVVWIRDLMRHLSAEGKTVLVSSHLMAEMAQTADHLVVLGRGRLVADLPTAELLATATPRVRVQTPTAQLLLDAIAGLDVRVVEHTGDLLLLEGVTGPEVGGAAARRGVELHELVENKRTLEEAFMELTKDAVAYQHADIHDPVVTS